jgi:hypothetical protein
MSPTPRREPEDMPGAENAEEPIAVGNELESLELNSGDLVSCVDEVAKPGHDIPVSHVWELYIRDQNRNTVICSAFVRCFIF